MITRGGGSVEDLLPFSEESLIRAVANAATPVVSAIGHEQDAPLLDLVADVRASTPTDAARKVVPDVAFELEAVAASRRRMAEAVAARLAAEQAGLDQLRSRPVLATPVTLVEAHEQVVADLVQRSRRALGGRLEQAAHRAHPHQGPGPGPLTAGNARPWLRPGPDRGRRRRPHPTRSAVGAARSRRRRQLHRHH